MLLGSHRLHRLSGTLRTLKATKWAALNMKSVTNTSNGGCSVAILRDGNFLSRTGEPGQVVRSAKNASRLIHGSYRPHSDTTADERFLPQPMRACALSCRGLGAGAGCGLLGGLV